MSPKYCEVLQGISRQYPSQEDAHDHLGTQNKPYLKLQHIACIEISFFHRTAPNSQLEVITHSPSNHAQLHSLLGVTLHPSHCSESTAPAYTRLQCPSHSSAQEWVLPFSRADFQADLCSGTRQHISAALFKFKQHQGFLSATHGLCCPSTTSRQPSVTTSL